MIELLDRHLIAWLACDKALQFLEQNIGNRKIGLLNVVPKLDRSLNFVSFEALHASRSQFQRKRKDWIYQPGLAVAALGRLCCFIRLDPATTVHGPASIRAALGAHRRCRLDGLIASESAASVVIVETAVGIVTLNQTSGRREILRYGQQ